MNVLVTTASRHGATAEIGRVIATVLRSFDIQVDIRLPQETIDLDDYDAVIIGSAVYQGHWLGRANAFVKRHREQLKERPVFLFSSGPLGPIDRERGEPFEVAAADILTRALDHQVFAGRLTRSRLERREKLIARMSRLPDGDYRPWDDVVDWARRIAGYLVDLDTTEPMPRRLPVNPRSASRGTIVEAGNPPDRRIADPSPS